MGAAGGGGGGALVPLAGVSSDGDLGLSLSRDRGTLAALLGTAGWLPRQGSKGSGSGLGTGAQDAVLAGPPPMHVPHGQHLSNRNVAAPASTMMVGAAAEPADAAPSSDILSLSSQRTPSARSVHTHAPGGRSSNHHTANHQHPNHQPNHNRPHHYGQHGTNHVRRQRAAQGAQAVFDFARDVMAVARKVGFGAAMCDMGSLRIGSGLVQQGMWWGGGGCSVRQEPLCS